VSENGERGAAAPAKLWVMQGCELDRDACYRAIRARDARFDGRFFTAVRTTGIYCRPICPARCPKLENVVFYPSAAAAQSAGFRPCLRCRPECSPELGAWRGTSRSVSRALDLIAQGALDGAGTGVDTLALRLGIGERHLRRLFEQHLGVSPIAVANTRRVLLAKQLIHETPLRMVDIAFAAGFGSLRRFNGVFRELYGRPPSALRRHTASAAAARGIALTLSYSPPYDWPALCESLAAEALPGVELVTATAYRRTIELDGCHGTLTVTPLAGRNAVSAAVEFADVRSLPAIIRRVRNLFDLDSDVSAIGRHLAEDPRLAPLVSARPGLRVPGAWDAFELAVRVIAGAELPLLLAGCAEPLAGGARGELSAVFPSAARLAEASLSRLRLSRARAVELSALARAVARDPQLLAGDGDLAAKLERLRSLPGIGERGAHWIALRALREPDAFPLTDPALRRRAEAWHPWRGYAAQQLAHERAAAQGAVA
jgi:AraC family transcriptional regulator of adaptative response / DNA-3-methyladenine glycosylase II